jgi:hypothetical protein
MAAWTPGFRRPPPGQVKKFGDHMVAFLTLHRQTVRVMRNPPFIAKTDVIDDTPNEDGDEIILSFDNGHKKYGLNLSGYTEEELLLFKQILEIALKTAMPIVRDRDRVAREAAENGNDIFYRRHRGTPNLSIIPRKVRQYAEGVPDGPQDVLGGDGTRPPSA